MPPLVGTAAETTALCSEKNDLRVGEMDASKASWKTDTYLKLPWL
jgi:hypothetical protein